jgi:small subunit ribosomal protein S27Ae
MAEEGAKPKAEKKVHKKERKQRTGRKHESKKAWDMYEVSGQEAKRKRPFCPRCGPGCFMSSHKNRKYCGKCGYTEIQKAREGVKSQ